MSTVGGLGKSVLRYYAPTCGKRRRQGSRDSRFDQGQPTRVTRTTTQKLILYMLSGVFMVWFRVYEPSHRINNFRPAGCFGDFNSIMAELALQFDSISIE